MRTAGFGGRAGGKAPTMQIDVHDQVVAGQQAAGAAKQAAKRATRRAAKQASVAADRVVRHQRKRTSKRGRRLIVAVVITGAVVALAVSVGRRLRSESPRPPADRESALDLSLADEQDALDEVR